MKNYLALIRKTDFNDLYRYGYIRIDSESSIEFQCAPNELPSHREVFDELAKNANAFDNAFVYTLIHFSLANEVPHNRINIENVQHIYPLDIEAYKEFSTSFDPKIQISRPLWNDAVFELQKKWAVDSAIKGANNIWKIFGITYPISKVQELIPKSIVEQTIDNLYSDMPIRGEYPLLVYLLRYERHAYYPKTSIGFFMDMVHTYCNYAFKEIIEEEKVEGTNAFKVLKRSKEDEKYADIIKRCLEDNDIEKFIQKLNSTCPEFSFFEVAPLFLKLRSNYSEGISGYNHKNTYSNYKKIVNSEEVLAIAMYLLGIVLGHEKTYDALYETLPLPLFCNKNNNTIDKCTDTKTKEEETPEANKRIDKASSSVTPVHKEEMASDQPSSITIPSNTNEIQNVEDIQSVNTDNSENDLVNIEDGLFHLKVKFPFSMGKPKKGGKGFYKRPPIVEINDEGTYKMYASKGYKIINEQK